MPTASPLINTPEALRSALRTKARQHQRIGELLVAEGLVKKAVVDAALTAKSVGKAGRIGDILVGMGVISREALDQVLSHQSGALLDVRAYPLNPASVAMLPSSAANFYQCLPVDIVDGKLVVAFAAHPSSDQLAGVRFASGQSSVMSVKASNAALLKDLLGKFYADASAVTLRHRKMSLEHYEVLTADENSPAAVLRSAVSHAIALGASDIHIRPRGDGARRVLFRVDGHLREMLTIDKEQVAGFVRHLEIFSNIDSFNRSGPKEGRFSVDHQGRPVDLRVSIIASSQGESVVMRILDPVRFPSCLDNLALPKPLLRALGGVLLRPHGLLVVTGPTGSGKTTTLYTLLKELQARNLHVVTAEDPVEYELEGVNQFETHDFASLLPQLLRHDPDVVMVGELRDEQTVAMALNAALTGHLVLSSVHSNDAASTVHRLLGLGAPLHLLASTLAGIVSQRLVRMTCLACAGTGCAECGRTGYLGRTLAAEMARPKASLLQLQGMPTHAEVQSKLEFHGDVLLDESIVAMASAGKTTWQEAAGLVANPALLPLAMRRVLGYAGEEGEKGRCATWTWCLKRDALRKSRGVIRQNKGVSAKPSFRYARDFPVGTICVDLQDPHTGLRGLVVRGPFCFLGYVGAPENHALYSLEELEFSCHFGITARGLGQTELSLLPAGWYFFGWDYGHFTDQFELSDLLPEGKLPDELQEIMKSLKKLSPFSNAPDRKDWSVEEITEDVLDALSELRDALAESERFLPALRPQAL